MNTDYKKVLVIHYSPDFAEPILKIPKNPDVEVVLVAGLSEGEDVLKKETFDLTVIECPIDINAEIMSKFLLQTGLGKMPVFLAVKEKRFLADLSGQQNISIFDQDEVCGEIIKFMGT